MGLVEEAERIIRIVYVSMSKLRLIISVWGRSKIGKTSTIKELSKILEKRSKPIYLKGNYHSEKGDFVAVFKINKTIIAIVSKGDPPANKRKKELLEIIKRHKPHVLFCASRTSGETVNVIRGVAKKFDSKLIWTSPYESDKKLKSYGSLNQIKARHLINLSEQP